MKQADKVIMEKMIGYCDDILSTMERFGAEKEDYDRDKVYQYATSEDIPVFRKQLQEILRGRE